MFLRGHEGVLSSGRLYAKGLMDLESPVLLIDIGNPVFLSDTVYMYKHSVSLVLGPTWELAHEDRLTLVTMPGGRAYVQPRWPISTLFLVLHSPIGRRLVYFDWNAFQLAPVTPPSTMSLNIISSSLRAKPGQSKRYVLSFVACADGRAGNYSLWHIYSIEHPAFEDSDSEDDTGITKA